MNYQTLLNKIRKQEQCTNSERERIRKGFEGITPVEIGVELWNALECSFLIFRIADEPQLYRMDLDCIDQGFSKSSPYKTRRLVEQKEFVFYTNDGGYMADYRV